MSQNPLYERLLAGDEAAFSEVYAALTPSMIRVARAITGNHATAEEVGQETWLAVVQGLEGFKGKASLRTWIFSILTNKARTRAKRDGRNLSLVLQPDAKDEDGDALKARFGPTGSWTDPPELWDELTPERILNGQQVWELVRQTIKTLPDAQQAILGLVQGRQLSTAEIAGILELSPGNIRVHLHRARERIRRALEEGVRQSEKKSD
jgi:RNA polymerase sigma factor (sigma-70 family)